MKNTNKYDTPDLRHVVISRLVKNAEKAFENEQMIDLSEEELYNITTKRPQVAGRLIHFLKNTSKYDTPDLRNVVISEIAQGCRKGL